jgi:hypothetical protein|tara:strand:+ start:532 stop:810 length:279 start_codon:yes stop_codon:yes gene_type:complete
MTEQELMDLDFEKVMVYDEESDNGYDYYYFRKQVGGSMFLAADTINKEGELRVNIDDPGLVIRDINLVKELINVFSKIEDAERKVSVSKENG